MRLGFAFAGMLLVAGLGVLDLCGCGGCHSWTTVAVAPIDDVSLVSSCDLTYCPALPTLGTAIQCNTQDGWRICSYERDGRRTKGSFLSVSGCAVLYCPEDQLEVVEAEAGTFCACLNVGCGA